MTTTPPARLLGAPAAFHLPTSLLLPVEDCGLPLASIASTDQRYVPSGIVALRVARSTTFAGWTPRFQALDHDSGSASDGDREPGRVVAECRVDDPVGQGADVVSGVDERHVPKESPQVRALRCPRGASRRSPSGVGRTPSKPQATGSASARIRRAALFTGQPPGILAGLWPASFYRHGPWSLG